MVQGMDCEGVYYSVRGKVSTERLLVGSKASPDLFIGAKVAIQNQRGIKPNR